MEKLTIDEIIGHCERRTEQYERLFGKERLETTPLISSRIKEYWEHRQVAEYLKKFKEYQQLEEQGRLVKLPCKVGDTVYHVVQGRIVEVSNVDLFFLLLSVVENRFNNSVFLTKSEAEAKLKELRGGEDER